MREIFLSYGNWFVEIVKPYQDPINAISTLIIAAFTVVLACVAQKQTRDARILQRAYLDAKFGGIQTNTAGELLGQVTFKNVGHLPAQKLYWLVNLSSGDKDWKPPKIKGKEMNGPNVIPIGAEWPKGSALMPHPPEGSKGLYLYVWGRVTYKDGFIRWRTRRLDFCHSYPWETKETPPGGGVRIGTKNARYHDYGNSAT